MKIKEVTDAKNIFLNKYNNVNYIFHINILVM